MQISDIDQEVTDFDWYAVEANGYLVQFASGGGPLPASVASSLEALQQLHAYFLALPIQATPVRLTQLAADIVDVERYVKSFVNYAQRGLFSFDKTDLAHRNNMMYHLVAYPEAPLSLAELPTEIAALASRTRLPFPIVGVSTIDAKKIK
jgi:hypothetical protein